MSRVLVIVDKVLPASLRPRANERPLHVNKAALVCQKRVHVNWILKLNLRNAGQVKQILRQDFISSNQQRMTRPDAQRRRWHIVAETALLQLDETGSWLLNADRSAEAHRSAGLIEK